MTLKDLTRSLPLEERIRRLQSFVHQRPARGCCTRAVIGALSSAILAHYGGAVGAEAKVLASETFSLLAREELRSMTDPQNSLEPSLKYLTRTLSATALAYYPAA